MAEFAFQKLLHILAAIVALLFEAARVRNRVMPVQATESQLRQPRDGFIALRMGTWAHLAGLYLVAYGLKRHFEAGIATRDFRRLVVEIDALGALLPDIRAFGLDPGVGMLGSDLEYSESEAHAVALEFINLMKDVAERNPPQ
jgi:hypothetical protein